MPAPKFSFVPERQVGDEPSEGAGYRVAIRKNGIIYFPADVVRIYDLEGKYVKLYADTQKKAIAWTVFDKGEPADMEDVRLMKRVSPKSQVVVLGIGRLLKRMGFDKGVEFPVLNVRKHIDPLVKGDMWYVVLEKEVPFKPKAD